MVPRVYGRAAKQGCLLRPQKCRLSRNRKHHCPEAQQSSANMQPLPPLPHGSAAAAEKKKTALMLIRELYTPPLCCRPPEWRTYAAGLSAGPISPSPILWCPQTPPPPQSKRPSPCQHSMPRFAAWRWRS